MAAPPAPTKAVQPRRTRWTVGALTLWQLGYGCYFIAFVVHFGQATNIDDDRGPVVLRAATFLLGLVLIAVYAVDVYRNPAVQRDRRTMWLLLLFFLSGPAMLVYWCRHMRARGTREG